MQNKYISLLVIFVTTLTAAMVSADEATYQATFTGQWSGSNLPGTAHFSPIVGGTHATPGAIFSVGALASPGVENVAELGVRTTLINEINAGIAAGTISSLVTRNGNIDNVQEVTFEFTVDSNNSLITLLTMIAPSPDWFVGVHDLDMLDGSGNWHQELVVPLASYDAGTENGNNYSLNNAPTVPQAAIADLDSATPNGILLGAGSIAQMIFTRTDATPTSFTSFRGNFVSGDLESVQNSDNDYLSYNPGFTLNSDEAPVWLIFDSPLAVDSPSDLELTLETGANTPGLTQTIEFFNFNTSAYEEVRSDPSSLNDVVVMAAATGNATRYVEQTSGNVRTRIGWRRTGFTLLFPWTARIDHIRWNSQP